jgi:hypothetical protein
MDTEIYLPLFIYVLNAGSVKVWDPRQKGKAVATMEPAEGDAKRDCWTVAFGNVLMRCELCKRYHGVNIKKYGCNNNCIQALLI